MANFNSRMDVEKLLNLKFEIDDELRHVKETLDEVNRVCQTTPGEDDSILKTIQETGDKMHETWKGLTNAFDRIGQRIQGVIDDYKKWIEDKVNQGKNLDTRA